MGVAAELGLKQNTKQLRRSAHNIHTVDGCFSIWLCSSAGFCYWMKHRSVTAQALFFLEVLHRISFYRSWTQKACCSLPVNSLVAGFAAFGLDGSVLQPIRGLGSTRMRKWSPLDPPDYKILRSSERRRMRNRAHDGYGQGTASVLFSRWIFSVQSYQVFSWCNWPFSCCLTASCFQGWTFSFFSGQRRNVFKPEL